MYVCSTDKFMSGWGKCENKSNRCYVEVDNWKDAIKVFWYLQHDRTDQNRITVSFNKPKDTPTKMVSHVQGWLETSERALKERLKSQPLATKEDLKDIELRIKYKFRGTFFPEMIMKEVNSWNLQ